MKNFDTLFCVHVSGRLRANVLWMRKAFSGFVWGSVCVCVCVRDLLLDCCRCDWLTAVDNGSVLSGLWRRRLVNKEIGSTLHLGPQPTGLMTVAWDTRTHITQKKPQTVIYPDCLLFSSMPAWAVRSMPETKRSAPWESKPHTHRHSLTYTHPLSLCLTDTLEVFYKCCQRQIWTSLFALQMHTVSHTYRASHAIAKNCFIGRLFDRFTQCLLNHVFDKFRREVINRRTYEI